MAKLIPDKSLDICFIDAGHIYNEIKELNLIDLSIILPSIRTPKQLAFYNSISNACKNYNWELNIVSPFPIHKDLESAPNVNVLRSYANVSCATVLGFLQSIGKFIHISVDDGVLLENSLDAAIDLLLTKSENDIINCRYIEGGDHQPLEYWNAYHHGDLRLKAIDPSWKISLQPLMYFELFRKMGLECKYEYSNHALHSFMFRAQSMGSVIYNSPLEVCNAEWAPSPAGKDGDHLPIHNAQTQHDNQVFIQDFDGSKDIKYTVNNLTEFVKNEGVWLRRFPGDLPQTYEEMLNNNS